MMSRNKHCRRCGTEMEEKHNYLDDFPLISSATDSVPEPVIDADDNNQNEKKLMRFIWNAQTVGM